MHGTLVAGSSTYDCFYNVISGPSFSCVGFPVIPDGDYTLQFTQKIGVATSLPTAPITVRIDTHGPDAAPRFLSPYDSSGANGDVHTTNPSMPVSGTYVTSTGPEAYATVHVQADIEPGSPSNNNGGTPSYCDAITDASGNWSCTPPTPMTFGDYYGFTVYGVDEAGTTGISPDPEFGVFVDVPAPVPDSLNVLQNQPIVELTGVGVAGGSIHGVVSNGQTCDAVVNSGHYECDFTIAPATDGSYTVTLTQTVGTASSPSVGVTVVLDQTAPTSSPDLLGAVGQRLEPGGRRRVVGADVLGQRRSLRAGHRVLGGGSRRLPGERDPQRGDLLHHRRQRGHVDLRRSRGPHLRPLLLDRGAAERPGVQRGSVRGRDLRAHPRHPAAGADDRRPPRRRRIALALGRARHLLGQHRSPTPP